MEKYSISIKLLGCLFQFLYLVVEVHVHVNLGEQSMNDNHLSQPLKWQLFVRAFQLNKQYTQ